MADDDIKENLYLTFRIVECLCIGVFIFGFLWYGTEVLKLSAPEFMMLYGGTGAVASEVLARVFHRMLKKKETTVTEGEVKE